MAFDKEPGNRASEAQSHTAADAGMEASDVRRLRMLLQLLHQLNSTSDVQTLLQDVVDSAIEITGAERGFLMLLENPVKLDRRLLDPVITPPPNRKPVMEFRVARSAGKKNLSQENFRISMTIANRVAETGQPAWVRDAQSNEVLKSDSVTDLDLRTILCVAMKVEKQIIGVIYVDSRFVIRRFNEEDLAMFEALSEHVARAIERSRLHEQTMEKAKLDRENQELRDLDRKKSDFIHMLCHEVRTPLTVIQGYSERLKSRKEEDPDQVIRQATIIYDEAKRLGRLVDDLLDISRIKSGQQQIHRCDTDLTVLIEKAVHTLRDLAAARKIDLTQLFARKPIRMSIDSDKIYQLVLNLLDNALKYTPEGGSVQVIADFIPALEVQGDSFIAGFAQVTVLDTGVGIPEGEKEKIFDEFYRSDSAFKNKHPGTGLGLSICRGIVHAHGGRIWVESSPGNGSKFVFTLPNYQPISESSGRARSS